MLITYLNKNNKKRSFTEKLHLEILEWTMISLFCSSLARLVYELKNLQKDGQTYKVFILTFEP